MPVFIASLEYEVIKTFNHWLHTLSNLILRVIIKKQEMVFYSQYIDWGGANKWGKKITS